MAEIYQSIYTFLQTPFDPDHKTCAPVSTSKTTEEYIAYIKSDFANDYKVVYTTDNVPALDGQYIDILVPPEQFTGFACNYAICEYRKQSDNAPNQWTTQGYICYFVRDSKIVARNVCRMWLEVDAWGTVYAHETYLVTNLHLTEGHCKLETAAPRIEPVKKMAYAGSGSLEYSYDMFTSLYSLVVVFATSQGTFLFVTPTASEDYATYSNMIDKYYDIVMGATSAKRYNSTGTEQSALTGQVVEAWIIPYSLTPASDPTRDYYMIGNGQVGVKFYFYNNTVISKDITIPIKYTKRFEYIVRAEIGAKLINIPFATRLISARGEFGDTFCARLIIGADEIDITEQYALPTVSNTESQYWAQNWSSAALRGITSGISLIAGAATGSAGGLISGGAGLLSIGEQALRVHNTPATTNFVSNSALSAERKGGIIRVMLADNYSDIRNDYIIYGAYCNEYYSSLTELCNTAPSYYEYESPESATDNKITLSQRYIKVDKCNIMSCYVNKYSGEQQVARFDGGVNQAAIDRLYNHMLRGIKVLIKGING